MTRTRGNGPRKSGKNATRECRERKKEKLAALQERLEQLELENKQLPKLIENRQRIINFMREASQRAAEARMNNNNNNHNGNQ